MASTACRIPKPMIVEVDVTQVDDQCWHAKIFRGTPGGRKRVQMGGAAVFTGKDRAIDYARRIVGAFRRAPHVTRAMVRLRTL